MSPMEAMARKSRPSSMATRIVLRRWRLELQAGGGRVQ
jgi:hypothetical protein